MIRPQTPPEQVCQHVLRMILARELEPHVPLQEAELAERLGVGRGPVRAALRHLAEFGIVEARPNQSVMARHLGPGELVHLHQAREALEGMAAELACGRLTPEDFARLDDLSLAAHDRKAPGYFAAFNAFDVELHRTVATRSGNPIFAREIAKLHGLTVMIHEQLELVLIRGGRLVPGERQRIRELGFEQHIRIISALKKGDPSACRRAMLDHIRSHCEFKVALMPATARPGRPAKANGRSRVR
jgi:DNA-binding GntR family transcriptional regulator